MRIPRAPTGFSAEKFFEGIYWHQRWQIFEGIFTPGVNPIAEMCDNLNLPRDLSGKRVLDIGAWNGCVSFECERRGAREVIALGPENPQDTGFYKIRAAIGSTKTSYVPGSIYDLNPDKLGYFDVVLCCGVLYHLRYPQLGIDNLRRICTGEVYVETFVIDNEVLLKDPKGIQKKAMNEIAPSLLGTPMWQFYQLDELEKDFSNWFGPNSLAVVQAFESAGFEARLTTLNHSRGTFYAKARKGKPEFLTMRCGEGVYYDLLVRHLFAGASSEKFAA
jgi:tRNA (mo5U34)-methyltransferase